MTNEQAIKVLLDEWKCIDRNDGINCDRQCEKCDLVMDSAILKDAYNMAIKALEQEPCDVSEYDKDHIWYKGGQYISLRRFLEVKAEAEKEPCDDAISRDAVLEMAYDMSEIDGEHFTEPCMVVDVEDIQNLPSVTPTHKHVEPTQKNNDNTLDALGDAISREEAIKAIKESAESPAFRGFMAMEQYMPEDAIEAIRNLPSVTSGRHKGRWILDEDKSLLFNIYKCSNCENIGARESKFCPNCGAKMVEPQEGSEKE